MCATCGCGDDAGVRVYGPGGHAHDSHVHDGHAHDSHAHDHDDGAARTVMLQQKILAKNDDLAAGNRAWLRDRGILAVNVMSSPGSGKTTLLERSGRDLAGQLTLSVVEGDQETALDADRIRAAGCQVVQINTGAGCHLDAAMVGGALRTLDPPPGSVVVIENVGNLVCPAEFDVGQDARAMVYAITEGEEKPLKYPVMFRSCELVVVNKMDLLPHLDFDLDAFVGNLRTVNPAAEVLFASARTGEGVGAWCDWLRARL